MNIHDETISQFKAFAIRATDEHTTAIKHKYAHVSSNEERLEVFRLHMDSLKNTLTSQLSQLGEQDPVLTQKLQSVYKAVINDFYKKEF